MKKMILVSPEQWARLQRGAVRYAHDQNLKEKELSDFIKKETAKGGPVKPESFDKYQTLFHRFIDEQKKTRMPMEIPFTSGEQEAREERDDERGVNVERTLGGVTFQDPESVFIPPPAKKSGRRSIGADGTTDLFRAGLPSYSTNFRQGIKRKSLTSTPLKKAKKKKRLEITLESPKQSPSPRKTRQNITKKWQVVKI